MQTTSPDQTPPVVPDSRIHNTPAGSRVHCLDLHLFVILILTLVVLLLRRLGLLPLVATRTTTAQGRGQGEVDVLLRVEPDDERRHVDDLPAHADVSLADQEARVVDRLGQTQLIDQGLEAALQEVLDLEGQHVIELHARLVQHADADETANEGIAFEETLGVFLVEGEQLTETNWSVPERFSQTGTTTHASQQRARRKDEYIPGSTTDLGQGELDTPDLSLVLQAILADELQLGVPGCCIFPVSPLLLTTTWAEASSCSVAGEDEYEQSSGLEGSSRHLGRLGVTERRHVERLFQAEL